MSRRIRHLLVDAVLTRARSLPLGPHQAGTCWRCGAKPYRLSSACAACILAESIGWPVAWLPYEVRRGYVARAARKQLSPAAAS